jgi:hypothetical protein
MSFKQRSTLSSWGRVVCAPKDLNCKILQGARSGSSLVILIGLPQDGHGWLNSYIALIEVLENSGPSELPAAVFEYRKGATAEYSLLS